MEPAQWRSGLLVAVLAGLLTGCPAADPGGDDDDATGDDDMADDDTADDDGGCVGEPVVTEIGVDELAAMLDGDEEFLLINTHVPYEGEIPGTDANIPFDDIDALVDYLGADLAVRAVVYCKSGPMSAAASSHLAERGYCHILDLSGGMNAWEDAGYTLDP